MSPLLTPVTSMNVTEAESFDTVRRVPLNERNLLVGYGKPFDGI